MTDLTSPRCGGGVGVLDGDLVAIAERIGDQCGRDLGHEVGERLISCAEEVHAQTPQPNIIVLGCRCSPARVPGNRHGLLAVPVRRFGRRDRCSRTSSVNGSGTGAACLPRVMVTARSVTATAEVGSAATLTRGWAQRVRGLSWGPRGQVTAREEVIHLMGHHDHLT